MRLRPHTHRHTHRHTRPHPRRHALLHTPLLAATLLSLTLAPLAPAHADPAPAASTTPATPDAPAPLADLVKAVAIPYDRFTLANGLRVIVHTDRKAPIVGVTTYYRVGSKNEPIGRTGFAHLYEHLFFGGSENVPNFEETLEAAGAGGTNGSTYYDRTNYVETVPTGALPLALFVESDRMGHLLGAVSQDKLDKQRGVVENEKRQGDNQPYGLVEYAVNEGLFPVGHPYRHLTIGAMADLDAATLGDVRQWYRDHYAPNNAILVLSGDIDVATARPLVERYFGDIPAGPSVTPVVAGPVTLPAPVRRELTDNVAMLRLMRVWSGPGRNDPDAPALDIATRVLGGLSASRLDNVLVRKLGLAVDVSAGVDQQEQVGFVSVSMDVKPGVARAAAANALDAEIASFLAEGPSQDAMLRAATQAVREAIGGLQVVGGFSGKGATLAEGLLYSGDPAHYRAELAAIAALTPAQVRDAARRWLGRPPLLIAVTPGARTESGDAKGGWGDEASRPTPPVDPKTPVPAIVQGAPRVAPPLAPAGTLAFPEILHARLTNGIPVTLARRSDIPMASVRISFDAGIAADTLDTPGTQGLMLAMLTEGTAAQGATPARSATALREAEERLGASITAGAGRDDSSVTLDALSANLAPSLALLHDVVRAPALAPDDVARVKQQRLAALASAQTEPFGLALRTLDPLLFGPRHPYGQPEDGLGDAASLAAATPASLAAAHTRWLRPELASITVVGDIDLPRLMPLLEANFGDWRGPASPPPVKAIDAPAPTPAPRIVLIDRPASPQAMIVAGKVLALKGRVAGADAEDANPQALNQQEALALANQVVGGDFLSRLNSDLREDKGWSYGVGSFVPQPVGARSLVVYAPVQTDRAGAAIAALIADMRAFPARQPVSKAERDRVIEGDIRGLAGRFETNDAVLGTITSNARLGRPEDYEASLPARWRGLDDAALDAAARAFLSPDGLVFVVVGDAKSVRPQLASLGLPIETMVAGGDHPAR